MKLKRQGHNVICAIMLSVTMAFAGGIYHNSNQSAEWIRTLHMDATTGIDGVFYNPAGLVKLDDGLHLSINNQTITQNKAVLNSYPHLHNDEFKGDVSAPLFPGIYLAYKMGNLALSAGFNPIGGGGSAEFADGLPSFEMPVSDLVPGLEAQGQPVTDYDLDVFFEGSSVYLGGQFGLSYKLSDMFSIAIGGRYVSAKNTYEGHLKESKILLDGDWVLATDFFTGAAEQYSAGAGQAQAGADGLQPLFDAGANDLTFETIIGAGYMTQEDVDAVGAGLTALGFPFDQTTMTPTIAEGYFNAAVVSLSTSAAEMSVKATLTADQEADVEQTATGFTPIFGLNFSPSDKLNIGFRYEAQTALEFENNTPEGKDIIVGFDETTGTYVTKFPDGDKWNTDLPAMLALGVSYQLTPKLRTETSFHYYFDKDADYDGDEEYVDENTYETGLALEYALSERMKLSAGYLYAKIGVNDDFQSDLSYTLTSNTLGFGGGYALSQDMILNVAASYTSYDDYEKTAEHLGGSGTMVPFNETYQKESIVFAFGLQYKF